MDFGDETLRPIGDELVTTIKESAMIDWSLMVSVWVKMRVRIRRLLAKYGYPPDLEERAIEQVLQQAELFVNLEVES
jgi:type I restriction enzyme R subunit